METQTPYTTDKMKIAKQTMIDGRINRVKYLKEDIERRSRYLAEEIEKGRLDGVLNETARIQELATEAKFIERELRELHQMFDFMEGKNYK